MGITEKELGELINDNVDIDKNSIISSDGKNLLTRIPKEVIDFLKIKKGNIINWNINVDSRQLNIKIIKNG